MTTSIDQSKTRPATHLLAIASLVLSILGLLPILPLVGSIAGIVTGVIARREIHNRPEEYTGEGTAKAGVILGWIGLVLGILAFLVICAGLLFFLPFRTIQTGPNPVITVMPIVP